MKSRRQIDRDLLRIAAFILFDAAVYHEALAGTIKTIKIVSLRHATPPIQLFLAEQWDRILRVNYEPVFGLAREVLKAFPTSPDTEAILRRIIQAAISVVSSGVLIRHDFMGRVYHRLLLPTTAHYYATYYTSIPAAWLLANLAVKSPHPDWDFGDLRVVGRLRFIDPACGSGTLLSAVYMAVKDLYILSRPASLDINRLHKLLVEEVLHGWDILDYATHLTLTTLSLHSSKIPVRYSNILTLPAGVDENGVHLGSLDVLSHKRAIVGKGFTTPATQRGLHSTRERYVVPEEEFGKYDLVIMNPPFSRSAKPNVKFGYSSPGVRKLMTKELQSLTRDLGVSGIGQAGLGAYFSLLALNLAKTGGRIALVLPRSMLSGVSWKRIRNEYLRQCEIEYVVSNYDPGSTEEGVEGWNWSENTDIGEVLIVCKKTGSPGEKRSVTYINLWRKPRNEVEAMMVSHQAVRAAESLKDGLCDSAWEPIRLRGQTVGCVYHVPHSVLNVNWLVPCVFADPSLNALVLETLRSGMPCVAFGKIASGLGADIKQVKDHFQERDHETPFPIVWGHQKAMNTICLRRHHIGWGRAKRRGSGDLHKRCASTLLVADRPHLSTEALLAMISPIPVLATAFWEVRLGVNDYTLPIVLWLNSTYGFLLYLAHATNSMGDIFKMKKDQLQGMPVVDPKSLALSACEKVYRRIANLPFLPFPHEFGRAVKQKGPRWEIDQFLYSHLPLPRITGQHYELLSRDPILTKERR